ncbi:hypothetical protein DE146DRAFT_647409 [Phaeosphaeria sp. MPI-PUGE-AT-0046c]|nr:hypothetical protein DE146DRAFT_647409 [Phaeosphaeria sp. MPI-PUGE-AT-0046c]
MAIAHAAVGGTVVNIVLPLASIIFVALRFHVRIKTRQPLLGDDWTILGALACCIAAASMSIWAAATGINGTPWDQLTREEYTTFRKFFFTDVLMMHFVYGIIKISVILFYKRIFSIRPFVIAANIALGLSVGFILTAFFTVLFCARGVSSFWNAPLDSTGEEFVLDLGSLIMAYAIIDIVLDVGILALPLPVIGRLHMDRSKRWAVAGVFLLGAFCLVCSIVRLYYVRGMFDFVRFDMQKRVEIIEENTIWAHTEAHFSTLTACLPILRPLVQENGRMSTIFVSIRSHFTGHSPASTESTRDGGFTNKSVVNRSHASAELDSSWYPMRPGVNTQIAAVPRSQRSTDGSMESDTILVKTNFVTRCVLDNPRDGDRIV